LRSSVPILCVLCVLAAGPASAGGVPRIHASGYETHLCQNGVVEESEQCDDGDGDEQDGCTSLCRRAVACNAQAFASGDGFAVDPASGRCLVLHEDALTFSDAALACSTLGGHLASVTSAAEAGLLQPLLQAGLRPWIGATDLPEPGSFSWLTGEPFTYHPFAPGQPDGDGHCLVVDAATGLWSDTHCDLVGFAIGHVCEFEP
jgi:cysteine-rich repeat protein